MAKDRVLPSRRPLNAGERREKFSSRKKPRNPLKSLDSDERIQGNPRKSNAQKRGLQSETARSQENPNGSTRATSRPAAERSQIDSIHAGRPSRRYDA